MNKLPEKYVNEHVAALIGAVMLHAGAVAWIMPSAVPPAVLRQQVIRISMVVPSLVAQGETVKREPKEAPVVTAPPKLEAPKVQKVQKKPQPEKKIEPEVAKAIPSIPTSGAQSPDATEKIAARTDPVFNAAYLHNPPPVYPSPARRQGVQGKVTLEVDVTAQGDARDVSVAHSSGSSLLDDAALDAVRRWRFIPAHKGDEVIEARVMVPVEFKLN